MIVFNKNRKVKYSVLMAEVLVRCSFLFITPLSPLTDIYHNDVYSATRDLRLPSWPQTTTTATWQTLISGPVEGRRLSLPELLVICGRSPTSTNRPGYGVKPRSERMSINAVCCYRCDVVCLHVCWSRACKYAEPIEQSRCHLGC